MATLFRDSSTINEIAASNFRDQTVFINNANKRWFTVFWKNFHTYGDVIVADEGLQIKFMLRDFEQGQMSIVPHLLRHGALVFAVSSEEPPHLPVVTFHDKQWVYWGPITDRIEKEWWLKFKI